MPICRKLPIFQGGMTKPQLLGGARPWHKNGNAALQFAGFFDMLLMDEILHHLGWLKPYK